jgi:hypothetical protein
MNLPMFPEDNLYSPLVSAVKRGISAIKRGTVTYLQNTAELEERIGMKKSIERLAPEYVDPNPLHRRNLGQKLHRSMGGYYNYTPPKDKPHYLDDEESLLKLAIGSIPNKLYGERGFIDPERQKLLWNKLKEKRGDRFNPLALRHPLGQLLNAPYYQKLMERQNPRGVTGAIPRQGSPGRMY